MKIGADDYLTKPFHLAELSSRVNAICRRDNFVGFNVVTFNEIKVKTDENQVFINDKVLSLTRKEYDLLLFFLANRDRIITKESIVGHLWGDNVILTDSFDFVYTHVKNLRKKNSLRAIAAITSRLFTVLDINFVTLEATFTKYIL